MKLSLAFETYQLPLKHLFTISRYTVSAQKTIVVSITDGQYTGYGEATANPYYNSTVEKITKAIASVKSIVEASHGLHPTEFWEQLEPNLTDDYFALCAIDCAYWDYYARTKNRTLRSFWSENDASCPLTNFTIGIDTVHNMKEKVKEMSWPNYKIKLGTDYDAEIVSAIRRVTNSKLRVDANCAWTAEETIKNSEFFKTLNVEFIEQPLRQNDISGMELLKQESMLPIIADESCQRFEDVERCAEYFNGINIKLMKCGGITPALKMIGKGRELGLQIMAGCMTESTVGISNLVQLAPVLDAIDADGAMLLEKDIAKGVSFDYGNIVFTNGFGSGATMIINA